MYKNVEYKRRKNNAFTLIELLAVIIILAIVALIATPIILDVVEDARISAGRSEANMILEGINNYCASEDMKYQLDNSYEKMCTKDMTKDDVTLMVNLGNATIDKIIYDGEKLTELVITSNNHKFTLCSSGKFVMDDEICNDEVSIFPDNLINILLKQYDESNTTGLVKDTTNENLYYYTGTNEEVANNFLWYGGHQWRVLEFNIEENTLTLITQQPLVIIQPASSVWNDEKSYESSYLNQWLNEYFWNSLDSKIQNNILNNTFNVGVYGETTAEQNVEKIKTIKKVGLLDIRQYLRAGGENSFLDIEDGFWLGNTNNLSEIFIVGSGGTLYEANLTYRSGIRPVIKISDIIVDNGDGTLTSSYNNSDKVKNTNEVQVGEYISVPYNGSDNACGSDNMCLFRVLSKDNDSIKVILNGLLPNTSIYGDTSKITTTHTIYTPLNNFANNISNNYRYTENKTFYIWYYPYSANESENYKDVQKETLSANVGLPTIGEMFTGNDIDMGETKIFVDANTIENPNIDNEGYWVMNRHLSSDVGVIIKSGSIGNSPPSSYGRKVRPVIFLKNNLEFTGGDGTAQNPYVLE